MNIFNEKVISQLEHYGKYDTARFVSLFSRMWKMLNIKSPEAGKRLNDPDREKFASKTDPRIDFLLKMATSIKLMDSNKRGARRRGLTTDTATAFHQTLHGMVAIINKLLDLGFAYVLPGKIMSEGLTNHRKAPQSTAKQPQSTSWQVEKYEFRCTIYYFLSEI